MNRRSFLNTAAVLSCASMTRLGRAASEGQPFKLKYAPHFGMFQDLAGKDLLDQVRFAADEGFRAWEDNGMMGRPVKFQEEFGELLREKKMTMGVFVSFSGFGKSDFVSQTGKEYQKEIRKKMSEAVEVAKRVGAKWTTVVPGSVNTRLEEDFMMANCIDNLRAMAEVCEPAGLVMVLEPLNWFANHPGLYLRKIPQAFAICRGVNSPSCKILDDLYHQQIQEGNLIPNLEYAWSEIAYFQVGDNPGRNEPTTGEINYRNIFKLLHDRKYDGVIGMEHGVSQKGKEGELALIEAYRQCDDF